MWASLEAGSITEIAVALGLDYVVVDAEHGHLDWQHVLDHVRAAVRSDTVVLVRIAEVQEGLIKRALDIGADGIVVPHVDSYEQLKQAIAYAKYPPKGVRGIGAERATGWTKSVQEHVQEADEVLVVPIIESVKGGEDVKAMATLDDVDFFYFGPADYAASAGHAGEWDVPEVAAMIESAKNTLLDAGKVCGVVTPTPEVMFNRMEQGFRMFGIGFDTGFIIDGIQQFLASLGKKAIIQTSLQPSGQASTPAHSLLPIPPGYEPDRLEGIYERGQGQQVELAPGIVSEALVGAHTQATNLMTAIVTFDAGPNALPAHTHPNAESITLLSGKAQVTVENRRYVLHPFDNVTVPKGCAHSVKNLSDREKAVFHIAMPTTAVERTLVNDSGTRFIDVPEGFDGQLGPETITRYASAHRYDGGSRTEFIDYFNDKMLPGVGMSGGYAFFHQNGRLPAHIHDFDESICIVEGEATCWVEGRKYAMSDLTTAMQPRGRVHYFINDTPKAMAMIWVYAGPMPERIEVAEEYAKQGIDGRN